MAKTLSSYINNGLWWSSGICYIPLYVIMHDSFHLLDKEGLQLSFDNLFHAFVL